MAKEKLKWTNPITHQVLSHPDHLQASTGDEDTEYYVNYRIEENGVVVSPIVKTWVAKEEMYWITYWSDDYTANFVIENNLIFIHTWHRDDGTADYLLLSDQSVGTIQTSGELFNPQRMVMWSTVLNPRKKPAVRLSKSNSRTGRCAGCSPIQTVNLRGMGTPLQYHN